MFRIKEKPALPDSEFDIEGESVISIDRVGAKTCILFYPSMGDESIEIYLKTPIENHNDYIKRFRKKLKKLKHIEMNKEHTESIHEFFNTENKSI